jgi:hypothetical protein
VQESKHAMRAAEEPADAIIDAAQSVLLRST